MSLSSNFVPSPHSLARLPYHRLPVPSSALPLFRVYLSHHSVIFSSSLFLSWSFILVLDQPLWRRLVFSRLSPAAYSCALFNSAAFFRRSQSNSEHPAYGHTPMSVFGANTSSQSPGPPSCFGRLCLQHRTIALNTGAHRDILVTVYSTRGLHALFGIRAPRWPHEFASAGHPPYTAHGHQGRWHFNTPK